MEPRATALDLAEELFFGRSAFLEDEPARILKDEKIAGLTALLVLEAVGRGAEKPSEIAARLETAQTNLWPRPFSNCWMLPSWRGKFLLGKACARTKKTRYRIQDPALRFWFQVYSPHRTRWPTYAREEKEKLIHDHASTVFEDYCRARHPDAARYWEEDVEFDFVCEEHGRAIISKVKFKRLPAAERRRLESHLAAAWQRSALQRRFREVTFEILDATALSVDQELGMAARRRKTR